MYIAIIDVAGYEYIALEKSLSRLNELLLSWYTEMRTVWPFAESLGEIADNYGVDMRSKSKLADALLDRYGGRVYPIEPGSVVSA